MAVIDADYDVVLATPKGTQPVIDPGVGFRTGISAATRRPRRARTFFDTDPSMTQVRTLRSVLDEGLNGHAAVFVPGGRGLWSDLMQDAELGEILRYFQARKSRPRCSAMDRLRRWAALPDAKAYRAALDCGRYRQDRCLGPGLAICRLQDDRLLGQRGKADRMTISCTASCTSRCRTPCRPPAPK